MACSARLCSSPSFPAGGHPSIAPAHWAAIEAEPNGQGIHAGGPAVHPDDLLRLNAGLYTSDL